MEWTGYDRVEFGGFITTIAELGAAIAAATAQRDIAGRCMFDTEEFTDADVRGIRHELMRRRVLGIDPRDEDAS